MRGRAGEIRDEESNKVVQVEIFFVGHTLPKQVIWHSHSRVGSCTRVTLGGWNLNWTKQLQADPFNSSEIEDRGQELLQVSD